MGVPLAFGWVSGDLRAGMIASLGAFTSLYGGDRPYQNRATLLAIVALSFALVVCLGVYAQPSLLGSIAASVLVAMSATFLCNALNVGPPGAYMFALACAVGTALPTQHLTLWHIGLLVLGGGVFSWSVQMAGVLFRPRGPELDAVSAAAAAIAQFAQSIGTQREDYTRHAAALSLYEAWTKLVTLQSTWPRQSRTLNRLRAVNRELHRLFMQCITATERGAQLETVAERAASLVATFLSRGPTNIDFSDVPFGHYGIRESICESLTWNSTAVLASVRVGLASTLAGVLGAAFGLDRAYWMVAASVLVLHQGLDWTRTFQRSIERVIGTLLGLGFAGSILNLRLSGVYLVAILTVLQFIIEVVVVRSYAMAVVFITATALIMASGGYVVHDLGHLLWVRGLDTASGCVIGLGVHAFTAPRLVAVPVPHQILRTLAAIEGVLAVLMNGEVTSPSARRARRDLQHHAVALLRAFELGGGAAPKDREYAERAWPTVVATQRLAYRVLGTCWSLEEAGHESAHEMSAALFPNSSFDETTQLLTDIGVAIRDGRKPVISSQLPPFLKRDLQTLADSVALQEQCGSS